jgi:hypothetical protein
MWWKMITARQWVQGMSRLRRSSIVLLVAVGLVAGAGIASAAEGDPAEEPSEDTLLNFGYDEDNHIFLVNTSATDSTYDCTLENGTLTAEYGPSDHGRIPVDMLLHEDQEVLFANRPEGEVGSDFTAADTPVAYAGADEDCGISGALVGGPNGQINHGQFMKLFHQLIDSRGMGCLNRVIAQSDLGKGDQQIRTSDVDATFAPETTGRVDFTTVAADCNRDKKDKGENHQASLNGEEKKDKGGKPGRPDSPGNSGNAPGHDK